MSLLHRIISVIRPSSDGIELRLEIEGLRTLVARNRDQIQELRSLINDQRTDVDRMVAEVDLLRVSVLRKRSLRRSDEDDDGAG